MKDVPKMKNFSQSIANLDTGHPVGFYLKDEHAEPEIFAPLRHFTVSLVISLCANTKTTGKVPN